MAMEQAKFTHSVSSPQLCLVSLQTLKLPFLSLTPSRHYHRQTTDEVDMLDSPTCVVGKWKCLHWITVCSSFVLLSHILLVPSTAACTH